MKGFKQFTYDPIAIDDFGKDSTNLNAITEAGLSRILQKVKQEDNDFVIITAYRGDMNLSLIHI